VSDVIGRAPNARAIAFYLPQFHPVPENDGWWGPGFTEWTNTARARPLFRGHKQPDLPADLGFYDLRLPESRAAQAELAQQYGIEAFCYWHYWFGNGRQILERPFTEVLRSGAPPLSFCLGWANQSWTGIWHGARNKILIEQRYPGPLDDDAHFDAVLDAFRDERYLRVDGRPVFYVFCPHELPDAAAFVDRWQARARRAGLEGLYLVAEVSDLLGGGPTYQGVAADGFDAGAYVRLPVDRSAGEVMLMRIRRKFRGGLETYRYSPTPVALPKGLEPRFHQPVVYPNWDNTPRSGRKGLALTGSSPEKFGPHVRAAVQRLADRPPSERLLWIKSWNEWAEGNHLEPDLAHGHGWLQAVQRELCRAT
jgi:lipopolysaccharide biosynthesis protein